MKLLRLCNLVLFTAASTLHFVKGCVWAGVCFFFAAMFAAMTVYTYMEDD